MKFAKYYYDEIIYPEIESVPPRYAIIKRNKWMVEKADCIIVYVNRRFGGAYTALKHGVNKKRKLLISIKEILSAKLRPFKFEGLQY